MELGRELYPCGTSTAYNKAELIAYLIFGQPGEVSVFEAVDYLNADTASVTEFA